MSDELKQSLKDAKVEELVSIQNKGYLRYKEKYSELINK